MTAVMRPKPAEAIPNALAMVVFPTPPVPSKIIV
jgi:hypothetical protein